MALCEEAEIQGDRQAGIKPAEGNHEVMTCRGAMEIGGRQAQERELFR
jgi:hypothetical protein